MTTTPGAGLGAMIRTWRDRPPPTAAALLGDPSSLPPRAELIRELKAGNRRFAELWAAGGVAAHREDHKRIEHPSVGTVSVDCDTLTFGESDLKIVILSAAPGSEDETKLRLAMVAGPVTTHR